MLKRGKLKKIVACLALGLGVAVSISFNANAATRAEISRISVNQQGTNFRYWQDNAVAKRKLIEYVRDVTDKNSPNFIPVEDRIAMFDMDGTLLCETTPIYFEVAMYLDRALKDPTYRPSAEDRAYAQKLKEGIYSNNIPKGMSIDEAKSQASVFAGMTHDEYNAFIKRFMEKKPEGMSNLKWGEAFFLPMVEVVSYLRANDFTVYIDSGSDREAIRCIIDGVLDIKPNNIIGTDIEYYATGQIKDGIDKAIDSHDYQFTSGDKIVRGKFLKKNEYEYKVSNIVREIGKQPVLSFGNSSGDTSMHRYVIMNNKYKAMAFALCCDDTVREHGNPVKAEKMRKQCAEEGWVPVSMKDDWNTIYGDNVKRTD